jgi:beta-glucosidase
LPLSEKIHSIAVIGGHADVGVLSGGGSSQVLPAGYITFPGDYAIWDPSSPLTAIRSRVPNAKVRFVSGEDVLAAARLAASSDVAIVFAVQHRTESADVSLTLPNAQDALISRVAQANPNTIVVLETGGAVLMPWLDHVAAVLEAWYPGGRGGPALARTLFGDINPSGKLPITIPRSEGDLPPPDKPVAASKSTLQDLLLNFRSICLQTQLFDRKIESTVFDDVHYSAGLQTGYKWYDAKGIRPLFPFGYGLSYSTFEYSNLKILVGSGKNERRVKISFEIRNSSMRDGTETAQIYVGLPAKAGEPPKRLVAWSRQTIRAGVSTKIIATIDPRLLSIWDTSRRRWEFLRGRYRVYIGASSRDIRLQGAFASEGSSGEAGR